MAINEQDNDIQLVQLIQKGDPQAMQALYRLYVRYLSAICSRYVQQDEDVKDILQDAFVKIFSSIRTFEFRGGGSLKGWMAKIVLNDTLKFIKKNNRLVFRELSAEDMDIAEEVPDTTSIPLSAIYEMIRELPDGYRTIFNLYVIEEKSHKEIAQLLNITEGTSASQFHRAKALLAKKIKCYKSHNSNSL